MRSEKCQNITITPVSVAHVYNLVIYLSFGIESQYVQLAFQLNKVMIIILFKALNGFQVSHQF